MGKRKLEINWGLLLLLLAGLALRLIALDQSFWLDEAVQVWASLRLSLKQLLFDYLPGDFNPPLYHLLLHFWMRLVGINEIRVRLLSVGLGVGCLWFFWKLTRALKFSSWVPWLLVVAPLHIYYSQEARMYILASFATLWAVWRFWLWHQKPTWNTSLLFAVSLLLLGFSHFLALLLVPFFFILGMVRCRQKRQDWKKLLAAFAPLVIAYLYYSPLLLAQLKTGWLWKTQFPSWGKTVGSFGVKSLALLPVKFIIGRISLTHKLVYGGLAAGLVVVYWLLPTVNCWRKKKYCWLLIGLFGPVFIAWGISFWLPVFAYFRFLYLLPFFYLLVACGDGKSGVLVKSLLMVSLICSFVYLLNPRFHRENWREAVAWIAKESSAKVPVLILAPISKPFEYYNRQAKLPTILLDPFDFNFELPPTNRVYLVSYGLPIFDPQDKVRQRLRKLGFHPKVGESFNRVGVEKWVKKQ